MADDNPQTQFVQVPFSGGMREDLAIEYLDPNHSQAKIVNGVFKHNGVIEKRLGLRHLAKNVLPLNASVASLDEITRLASTKASGLLEFSSDTLYNQSDKGIAGVGGVPNVRVTQTSIVTHPASNAPRFADFGDLRLTVTEATDFSAMYISVYNVATGAIVLQPQKVVLTTTLVPGPVQVFLNPNKTHVVIVYITGNNIKALFYDISTLVLSAPVTLGVGGGLQYIDVCPFVNDPQNGFILVGTAGSNIDWWHIDGSSGAILHSGAVAHSISFVPRLYVMAQYGAAEFIWVTYGLSSAGSHLYHVFTMTGDGNFTFNADTNFFGVPAATSAEQTPFARLDAGHAWIGFLQLATDANSQIIANWGTHSRITPLTTISVSRWPLGLYPWGKPITDGEGINASVIMPCALLLLRSANNSANDVATQQPTLYLVKFTEQYADKGLPIATAAPRTLNQASIGAYVLLGVYPAPFMSCGHIAGGVLPVKAGIGGALNSTDHFPHLDNQGSAFAADFEFSQDLLFQTHELGDGAHISSGVPFGFDGTTVSEEGYFYYPEFAWNTITHPGTGTLAGKYGVAYVYRYTDANGNDVESAPFFTPLTTTLAAGDQITYHVPRLSMSWRHNVGGSPVYCDIYRTVGNGSTYYLLNTIDVTPIALPLATTDWWATFGPNATPDSDITVATLLYTTGGVLDNINPPGALCQCTHKNRLWIVDPTGTVVWFTQEFQPGQAISFNETLRAVMNEGGPINAIFSMDDKFVAFKEDSIWVIFGDPPPATGIGSSLTAPQRIVSDVGVIDWRSIVLTPHGLMFRASAGIHMLSRGLQTSFIGKPIQDTLGQAAIVSAELVAEEHHVRFALENSTTVIVFDYHLNQWSTYDYSKIGGDIVDMAVVSGKLVVASDIAEVFQENQIGDTYEFLDQDENDVRWFVSTTVTQPFVKSRGIQGMQRVRLVQYFGRSEDSHGLELDIAFNDDDTTVQSAQFTSVELSSNDFGDQCIVYVESDMNICESIQTTIRDVAGDAVTNGQGAVFVTMGYDLDIIGKRWRRVPVTARQ